MGRVIACGIPQGAGQNRTAEYRREQNRNSGIPQGTGQETAEYRRKQDRNSGIPQGTGLETAEYRREQDWKRRNTAGNRTEQNGGIPPRAGQKQRNTAGNRTGNGGIPRGTGLNRTAEYRGEQD